MSCILQADLTLIDGHLERGVVVHVSRDGTIARLTQDQRAGLSLGAAALALRPPVDESQPGEFGSPRARRKQRLRNRLLVPGFVNAHSHAFQRLLRGRTEFHPAGQPDGGAGSWQDSLRHVLDALGPDDLEAVSAFTFMEMLRAGFTHVAEFHFLHHDRTGAPYAQPAELSMRVLNAAAHAGIGITLVRAGFQHSGPDSPPAPEHRRFVDRDPEDYLRGLEQTVAHAGPAARRPVQVGLGAYNARNVDPHFLRTLARTAEASGRVLHAHVARDPAEVERCLAENDQRPLEYLAECGLLSDRFTAIHATCLGEGEADLLGAAGGAACICPTSERNIGRGLPDLSALAEAGVTLAIGSDSQTRIDPFAEIIRLEYGERLRTGRRSVLTAHDGTVAPRLLEAGALGGAAATGLKLGQIAEGCQADLVALDLDDPALAGVAASPDSEEALLAALVLGGHTHLVRDVWVGGRQVVTDGVMLRWQSALESYRKVARRVWG
jgi:formimidoylglutamate deiminase